MNERSFSNCTSYSHKLQELSFVGCFVRLGFSLVNGLVAAVKTGTEPTSGTSKPAEPNLEELLGSSKALTDQKYRCISAQNADMLCTYLRALFDILEALNLKQNKERPFWYLITHMSGKACPWKA